MRLYIDEAGHTGKHLFDPAQPLFVYAGVWLDEATELRTEEAMSKAFSRNAGKAAERKGSKMIGSSPGRRHIHKSLRACLDARSPVSVVIFHKPFQAAAVVVEDCTDYVYNDAFAERWTWDTTLKEGLARRIYENANPRLLMDVWRTRLEACDEFVSCYDRLLLSLELAPDRALSELAHQMRRADLPAIWKATQAASAEQWAYSPNLNAFVTFIKGAHQQARKRGLKDVRVVHDEQLEYQASLTNAFKLFRDAQPGRVVLPNGNVFETPLDSLHSLSFASSATESGLQMADLVASCARLFVSAPSQVGPLSGVARWLLDSGDGVFPFVFGPSDWQVRVLRRIAQAAS